MNLKQRQLKIVKDLRHKHFFIFFLYMYKICTFSIKTWGKIDGEAINHNDKKWINEKYLEKPVGYKNLAFNKTQYYSDKF